jgi:hypothetical protein
LIEGAMRENLWRLFGCKPRLLRSRGAGAGSPALTGACEVEIVDYRRG